MRFLFFIYFILNQLNHGFTQSKSDIYHKVAIDLLSQIKESKEILYLINFHQYNLDLANVITNMEISDSLNGLHGHRIKYAGITNEIRTKMATSATYYDVFKAKGSPLKIDQSFRMELNAWLNTSNFNLEVEVVLKVKINNHEKPYRFHNKGTNNHFFDDQRMIKEIEERMEVAISKASKEKMKILSIFNFDTNENKKIDIFSKTAIRHKCCNHSYQCECEAHLIDTNCFNSNKACNADYQYHLMAVVNDSLCKNCSDFYVSLFVLDANNLASNEPHIVHLYPHLSDKPDKIKLSQIEHYWPKSTGGYGRKPNSELTFILIGWNKEVEYNCKVEYINNNPFNVLNSNNYDSFYELLTQHCIFKKHFTVIDGLTN